MIRGRWWRKFVYLVSRGRCERELEEEMLLHRELREAQLWEAGEPDAKIAARRRFGNDLLLREQSRDLWGWRFLEELGQDVRYTLRQFRKNVVFTLVLVATLSLGIGANTAIFTAINGVLLRPLPFPDPDRLVALSESRQDHPIATFSYPNFQDLQRESRSFEAVAAWQEIEQNVSATAPGDPQVIKSRHVSAGIFSILGVHMAEGRDFASEEDRQGGPPVVILGYKYWQRRFGGVVNTVGRTLTLNGRLHTVVGILPPGFRFFGDSDVIQPLGQDDPDTLQKRDVHPGLLATGRLKQTVTLDHARSELDVVERRLAQQYPKTNEGVGFAAIPEKQREVGDTRAMLLVLAGAAALILLIACTNVANVLLAQSSSRRHEFAIRVSLGAGRTRLIRQLITESTLLSLLGGMAGSLLAFVLADLARNYMPRDLIAAEKIVPDGRVLLFAFLSALITGFLFGLAPVFQQLSERVETLRQATRGTPRGLRRMQSVLVVAQVALTLVLLVGAGLMLRTLFQMRSVNPGFDPHNVYLVRMALPPSVIHDPAAVRSEWRRIIQDVEALPGVDSASINFSVPLGGDESDLPYWTTPNPPAPNRIVTALNYTPSPDYLRTMRIPLLRGRFFTALDHVGTEPVVVIDDLMAARAFPHEDALGKKITFLVMGPMRVIGVVGHVKHESLDEEAYGFTMEEAYFPLFQLPDSDLKDAATASLLIRSAASPVTFLPDLRKGVLGPSRDHPIQDIQPLEDVIASSTTLVLRKVLLALLGGFAGVALLLASVGIYGVISHSVNQRNREMGIRMALGAQTGDVETMVLRQGMAAVLAGLAVGIAASLLATQAIKVLLYKVQPFDPLTITAVVGILTLVAWMANWIPARRASRVDPVVALRYE